MLTEQVARLLGAPPLVTVSFLARISSPGLLSIMPLSPDPTPKQSIVELRMSFQRRVGFASFYSSSFTHLFPLLLYYDNVSAVYLSTSPVQHQRTKHIKIDTLCARQSCHEKDPCPTCSILFSIRRYLY